jgi:glycosyltransferase involved in cell wall biosynthesis
MGRDLAKFLVLAGMDVTLVCPFPSRPIDSDYPGLAATLVPRRAFEDGIDVVRVPSYTHPGPGLIGRFRESLSFGSEVCRFLKAEATRTDVIYANSWPFVSQAQIARFCSRNKIPLVLHIQDIYPESFLNRTKPIFRWLFATALTAVDKKTATQARKVVLPASTMLDYYKDVRKVPSGKLVLVRNWIDEGRYHPLPSKASAFEHYRIEPNRFTFLYLGNIGPVAGVELLVTAFLRSHPGSSQLIIAGDGQCRNSCMELAGTAKGRDIHFISDKSIHNAPLIQSMADICLLPVIKGAAMSSAPSKMASYMFSSKPILASVDPGSETAAIISNANCGWVRPPGDVEEMAHAMASIATLEKGELEAMGSRGRKFATDCLSGREGSARLASCVMSAA